MKQISLTQNRFVLVDDEDFDYLNQWKWGVNGANSVCGRINGKFCVMSRIIMSCQKGLQVDHINMNTLDNRKENLRICTSSLNCVNRPPTTKGLSGYRGVTKHINKWWRARIEIGGKKLHLGLFRNPKDAAHAYNQAAKKYFGEFARINPLIP